MRATVLKFLSDNSDFSDALTGRRCLPSTNPHSFLTGSSTHVRFQLGELSETRSNRTHGPPIFLSAVAVYTGPMPEPSTLIAASRRSQLLVSVRNLDEAKIVAAAGVDVIDFKEPRLGPLAPVDAELWEAAAATLADAVLSAALGESETAVHLASRVPTVFRFAKVGPSGLRSESRLKQVWRELPLPTGIELVSVAYADHDAADCVDVEQVLDCVIASGRSRLLIDTFVKDGRSLTDHLSCERLVSLLERARTTGIWIAFAGSLCLDEVQRLSEQNIRPDCWGVRGDVCSTSKHIANRRAGQLDQQRVKRWIQTLRPDPVSA